MKKGTLFLLGAIFLVSLLTSCSSPGNYDLTSNSISHDPAHVYVGDKVVFTMNFINAGKDTIPAKSYMVEFYVNGKLVSFDRSTPMLEPGDEITLTKSKGFYHFEAKKPGIYKYKLLLDPRDTLPETNETNNVFSGTIKVEEK